jgi:hypothetical protein
VPETWKSERPTPAGQPFTVLLRDSLDAKRAYRFRFTVSREGPSEEDIVVDGETPRTVYVSADAGVLYASVIETGAVYIGSNIYFRPVNKRAPLGRNDSFLRRAALTIGFTVTSIADENHRTRSDLFGRQSLVLGGGLRLTESVRAGAGVLLFKEADSNPLITRTSAATTPYISFSFDLDVGSTFRRLGW